MYGSKYAIQAFSDYCVRIQFSVAVVNITWRSLWSSDSVILWLFGVRVHFSHCLFASL